MKKLGCASCGGTMKKMSKGGMATKAMGPGKQPFAAGIPYFTGAGQTGPESMKKGGTKKEHVLTTFRKANDARNAMVKKSLPKAQKGKTIGKPTYTIKQSKKNVSDGLMGSSSYNEWEIPRSKVKSTIVQMKKGTGMIKKEAAAKNKTKKK